MAIVVVTPPAEPLIALAVAKADLRVEHDDHDALIAGHIEACADWLDGPNGIMGLALGMQTLRVDRAEGFRGLSAFDIPMGPVDEVLSIAYRDADGVDQEVAEGVFEYDPLTNRVRLLPGQSWPDACGPIFITWRAGYGPDALPQSFQRAILLHLRILYDQPDDKAQAALERARDSLLGPKRVWRV